MRHINYGQALMIMHSHQSHLITGLAAINMKRSMPRATFIIVIYPLGRNWGRVKTQRVVHSYRQSCLQLISVGFHSGLNQLRSQIGQVSRELGTGLFNLFWRGGGGVIIQVLMVHMLLVNTHQTILELQAYFRFEIHYQGTIDKQERAGLIKRYLRIISSQHGGFCWADELITEQMGLIL